MENKRVLRRVLAAAITLTSFALPSSASASSFSDPQDTVITNFPFSSLDSTADRFDRYLVSRASNAISSYLATPSIMRTFVFKGYTDVRCDPVAFKKRYPRLDNLCVRRADKTTLGNWTLSLQRANTLKTQVTAGLSGSDFTKARWVVEGLGESKAEATLTDCRRAQDLSPCADDRRAEVVLRRSPGNEPAVKALGDDFVFPYNGDFSGDLSANDLCPESPCSWSVITPPSAGRVELSPSGQMRFTPTPDFSGTVSLQYRLASRSSSDTALVNITILPPSGVVPGEFSQAVKLTAPLWARLSLNERFSLGIQPVCSLGSVSENRCGNRVGSVGAYTEIMNATVTEVSVAVPLGYPSHRFSVEPPALGSVITPNKPLFGTAKFSQATQPNAPFKLTIGLKVEYRLVWYHTDRANNLVIDLTQDGTRYVSVSADMGVVGNVAG